MLKLFGRHSYILMFFVAVALSFSLALFAWLKIDVNEKRVKLEVLTAQLNAQNEENNEIKYLINDADEAELYEHLARDRGYVYPDEKVYYNVTPGN